MDNLKPDLSGAALGSYVIELPINNDWVSFRHPDFPWSSASQREQRFNRDGQTAFYIASGDYCGQVEVPNYYERTKCSIASHTVRVFDLHRFATDYDYGDAFVQERDKGGWAVCQEISDYLTNNHGISGILYQSAAMNKQNEFGYCMALLPGREQTLPEDFFKLPTQADGIEL